MKIGNCKLKIKDTILDILFPRICIGCGREGKYICDKCGIFVSEAEPLYQNKFGTGQAFYHLGCLDGLTSVWEYEGLIKDLIQMVKYQGVTDIVKELISLINIEIYYPYITYVPMYLKREKERGFNQAEIIAREIGKKSQRPVIKMLEKIKKTKDQTNLSKEERLENVKAAFALFSRATASQGEVLLVDDVFTTGATMEECCKVLKKAGVKKVWGFTLARTA